MEPERFCRYCDFGYSGSNDCIVAEFYPKKGFCSKSYVEGIQVLTDCLSLHVGEKTIAREDRSGLVEAIWQEKLKRREHSSQLNLKKFFSWART